MFSEIEVSKLNRTKAITTFIKRRGENFEVIVPMDYYKEPVYMVRRNPVTNGYVIKGEVMRAKTEKEARFYQRRAEKRWHIPLRWQMTGGLT